MSECPECGREMVSVLGGDACHACQIFFTPYGFKDNWELR